jgi:hypothetical protein
MKTIEETVAYLIETLDHIEARPKMFGSGQSEIFLAYIMTLGNLSFILEKSFQIYDTDVKVAKLMKHEVLSSSLPGHHYDDEQFMTVLKLYRKFFFETDNV